MHRIYFNDLPIPIALVSLPPEGTEVNFFLLQSRESNRNKTKTKKGDREEIFRSCNWWVYNLIGEKSVGRNADIAEP